MAGAPRASVITSATRSAVTGLIRYSFRSPMAVPVAIVIQTPFARASTWCWVVRSPSAIGS